MTVFANPRAARRSQSAALAAGLALALGLVLRLVWGADIEWKADEIWTFTQAHALCEGAPWPATGMPTSLGSPNPGMSLWIFVPLACVTETPPGLARAVALTNCAALLGLLVFVLRVVPAEDRAVWLWALAIHAVNPLVVLVERKIWPPSLLPILMLPFLIGWWRRQSFAGAALWGAAGAIMAQVHMAAGLLALCVAIWTMARERLAVRWIGWLAGSALAALPLLPWVLQFVHASVATGQASMRWRVPNLTYFLRWPLQAAGLGVDYFIGRAQFLDFLAWPRIAGVPTWLVAACHVVLAAVLIAILVRLLAWCWRVRPGAAVLLAGGPWREGLLLGGALWGVGLLLTASMLDVHRHYVSSMTVLPALWLARAALPDGGGTSRAPGALLAVLVAAQAIVTVTLLVYVHDAASLGGDFGVPWRVQQPAVESLR